MSAGRRACSKKMKRVQLDATVLRGNAGGRCAPDTGGQAARDGQRARANARRRQFQWAREAGVRTGCDGGPTGAQQADGARRLSSGWGRVWRGKGERGRVGRASRETGKAEGVKGVVKDATATDRRLYGEGWLIGGQWANCDGWEKISRGDGCEHRQRGREFGGIVRAFITLFDIPKLTLDFSTVRNMFLHVKKYHVFNIGIVNGTLDRLIPLAHSPVSPGPSCHPSLSLGHPGSSFLFFLEHELRHASRHAR